MKKILKKVIVSLAVVAVFLSVSCGNKNTSSAVVSPDSSTHIVIDHLGKSVEVPNEISNVVVTDIYPLPSVLTIFFDSADKIVGMAPPSMVAAKNSLLSELYPNILNAKTDFITGANINMEELIKLNPDVVFYPASDPTEGELLMNAGIPAIAISVNKWNYNAIETLNNWIDLISQVFNVNERAEIAKKYSNDVLKEVKDRVKDINEDDRRRAFFLFQYNENQMMTSGRNFFGNWWAEAIGAKNVAYELEKDNSVAVNMEQVYDWNPNLIYITNFTSAYPDDLYDNTIGNYNWSEIDAVKNKECFKMPLGMYRTYTPGIDTPITLYYLAKCAYPDLFSDINITDEVKKYYNQVFNINLTDSQVDKIFNPNREAGTGFSNGK